MHSMAFSAFKSMQPTSNTSITFSFSPHSSNPAVTSAILFISTSLSLTSPSRHLPVSTLNSAVPPLNFTIIHLSSFFTTCAHLTLHLPSFHRILHQLRPSLSFHHPCFLHLTPCTVPQHTMGHAHGAVALVCIPTTPLDHPNFIKLSFKSSTHLTLFWHFQVSIATILTFLFSSILIIFTQNSTHLLASHTRGSIIISYWRATLGCCRPTPGQEGPGCSQLNLL